MMKIHRQVIAAALLGSLGFAADALAADGAELYQVKACFSCHGPNGRTPLMPSYPTIAGQNVEYAVNQMKDIKSGARANGQAAAMKGVIATVSEEEMQAIAVWLATQ